MSERQRVKLLCDMMGYYRQCCPRIGGYKLFHLLEEDLGHPVTRGRDSFLRIYESKGFKLKPNK
ncbi:IS3 family transposase, partial [Parabacteroides distasonis]|nr:IS3 family transposase [Parabacteroides distasonis]